MPSAEQAPWSWRASPSIEPAAAGFLDRFEIAADLSDAAQLFEDFRAFEDAERLVIAQCGEHRIEVVRFLSDVDNRDPHLISRTAHHGLLRKQPLVQICTAFRLGTGKIRVKNGRFHRTKHCA